MDQLMDKARKAAIDFAQSNGLEIMDVPEGTANLVAYDPANFQFAYIAVAAREVEVPLPFDAQGGIASLDAEVGEQFSWPEVADLDRCEQEALRWMNAYSDLFFPYDGLRVDTLSVLAHSNAELVRYGANERTLLAQAIPA